MITLIASQLQDRLQDGSCTLISGALQPVELVSAPQTTALVSAPQTTALVSGSKTTAAVAINKTALTTTALLPTGGTTLTAASGTGSGVSAALGAGTVAGTILGLLVVGLVAYGVNKAVRVYIE